MDIVKRVMCTMTHINIGSVIALVAWILWSCEQGAPSPATPDRTTAEASDRVSPLRAGLVPPLTLISIRAGESLPSCCRARTAAHEPVGSPDGASQ